MAIVEMKKLTLLALRQNRARLLRQMQKMGCVQLIEVDEKECASQLDQERGRLEEIQKLVSRLDVSIARLSTYDKHKAGLFTGRPQVNEDQAASILAARKDIVAVVERVEQIERTRGELRARETREKVQIDQLMPWVNLEIPLDQLGETKTARLTLVVVPLKGWDAFLDGCSQLEYVQPQEVSRTREGVNVLVAAHKSVENGLDDLIKECAAVRVNFGDQHGTVAFAIDQLHDQIKKIEDTRVQLTEEMGKLADQLPVMRILRDLEAIECDRLASAERCLETQSAFLMRGWVPENRTQELEQQLKRADPLCQLEFADPEPDEQPPVLLHNNKVVSPFESIVKMFALPDPRGYDPTWIMMPFWVCFFGMMVSDAGYGVILGLAAAFVWWKLKGKGIGRMAFVLALGGISTVIWGSIYGGWFGTTPYTPLLDPMNDAISVLLVCVAAGYIHLMTGLGVAAYMSIRRGKPWDALFDQGFWMLILIGIPLILVNGTIGGTIAIVGAAGVLCTAGRSKKGVFKKITSGFGALYGITSYLSDLLSYARLFGMGLATGVIGMVMNQLASLLMGSPIGVVMGILVLLVGHGLNIGINVLGAYVHSCRLQYIEFFGKFYESGGRDFVPLAQNTRYVDITEEG